MARALRFAQDHSSDDDDDGSGGFPVFSGMRDYAAEVDEIDAAANKHLDSLLQSLSSGGDAGLSTWSLDEFEDDRIDTARAMAGETVVAGFASHQSEFRQQLVAKKLRLMEKQAERREKQLARLVAAHKQANATIAKLQRDLQAAQEELETAQQEWEEERESIMRFRGANGGGDKGAFTATMVIGNNGKRSNDIEAQRQRELKLQLLLKGAAEAREMLEDTDGLDGGSNGGGGSHGLSLLLKKARAFIRRRLDPFSSDIRQVEARFGYSVASYFRFLEWVIKSFVLFALSGTAFLVLHVRYLLEQQWTAGASIDWFAFSGIAPRVLVFPGYMADEAFLYTSALLVVEALLLLFTLRKWIVEDRQAKVIEAVGRGTQQPRYSKIILNAWDFSLVTQEQASDLRKSIAEQLKVTMEEEKLAEKLKQRTKRQRYILYARRFFVAIMYFGLQMSSWYVIIMLTTQSSQLQLLLSIKAPILAPYSGSIVPAAVTVINSMLPAIISLLTKLEKWDDAGFAIKIMVTRLYLAKVLNVLIQMFSFTLLLNPYLLTSMETLFGLVTLHGGTIRANVMVDFKPGSYACRAEQVASGLLTLVVTDFAVSKVMAIVSPFIALALKIVKSGVSHWQQRRREHKSRKKKANALVVPASSGDGKPQEESPAVASPAVDTSENRSPTATAPDTAGPGSKPSEDIINSNDAKEQQPAQASSPDAMESAPDKGDEKDGNRRSAARTRRLFRLYDKMPKSEFQVPQKMVAMLYSCTITLIAIPLAPSVVVLALLIHALNFKFDKLILMRFQKKPTSPWAAKDAGSFFVKFYFCTVVIFVLFSHYILLNSYLAKQCELQDSVLAESERLCVTDTFNTSTNLCALSTSQPSSAYFDISGECADGYPRCVCAYSCGPFVSVSNGMSPFLALLTSISSVSALYSLLLDNKVAAWVLLFALALTLLFMRNSIRVHVMVTLQRESEMAWTFSSLRKKIKQLENRLRIHKVGGSAVEDKPGGTKPRAP